LAAVAVAPLPYNSLAHTLFGLLNVGIAIYLLFFPRLDASNYFPKETEPVANSS